ncbi:MAG TPA: bifunctional 2-polyprenyl-6-hydroxyphenol methylase/3-demethylubiquinol 3-O-methyltransferase UbiG, partial [Methylomirabilota bacterium]|nr:bifunctional 2-polyprenyl-6-hydroxyphenol methylase/3-demethylubiquinol 3-O-methyltransferase UbiG [Methylomirabilota bacterium]
MTDEAATTAAHRLDTERTGTVDPREVEQFSRLAAEWWNPKGKFKPLHKFNPVRLGYLKREVSGHFGRDAAGLKAFEGLRILDIGCGGGLVCEPLARLGADVVGVDPSNTNIEVARLHAEQSSLTVDYRASTAEELAAAGERFDVVLALEVVEHVSDVPAFLSHTAEMVKPGGLMVVATINRTLKALGLA